ncbi:hypothetical protein PILCRDRAFT_742637 [Piloderma croceum F 1598]|uniref:Uncharacterized protein n=1 Tax=Piloderma croceum (strain F 1598) TaxID=765440 RepID=A0A0C3EI53_PILCF|nr:hypothetical protein PILCRDRAFT_742637 [Piloderma croceum F 1598]
MCCIHHKNGRFDFCGITCRDKAKDIAPLLLDVPKGHTTFTKVEGEFQKSWKPAVSTLCPPVRQVYRVVESSALLNTYTEYWFVICIVNAVFQLYSVQQIYTW